MEPNNPECLAIDVYEDPSNTCRACLLNSTKLQSFDINHFADFTSLSVNSNDALPQNLCQPCCEMLLQCNIFKTLCWQSDAELRKKNQNMLAKLDFNIQNENLDQDHEDAAAFKLTNPNCSDDQDTRFTLIEGISLEASDMDIADEFLKEMASETDNMITSGDNRLKIIVRILRCMYCFKHFTDEECFQMHLQSHEVEKPPVMDFINQIDGAVFNVNFQDEDIASIIGKTFKCELCLKIYNDEDCFQMHMKNHDNKPEDNCNDIFFGMEDNFANINTDLYDEDIASIIGKTFQCLECSKLFNDEDCYEKHLQIHKDEVKITPQNEQFLMCKEKAAIEFKIDKDSIPKYKRFKCIHCLKYFRKQYYLKKHLLVFHKGEKMIKNMHFIETHGITEIDESSVDKTVLKCKYCLQICKSEYYLKRHVRIFHKNLKVNKVEVRENKKFDCHKCLQSFDEKYMLKRHLRFFHKEQETEVDNGILQTNQTIVADEEDKNINTDIASPKCIITDNKEVNFEDNNINTFQTLQESIIYFTQGIICEFKCEHCSETFPQQHLKDAHMSKHTNCIELKCEPCEKTFSFRHQLIEHLNWHKNIPDLACDKCGKLFKARRSLLAHSVIHKDERKYKCNYCSKSFHYFYLLRRHVATHEKIADNKCELCNKVFKTKKSLSRHLELHVLEKFKCNVCGKGFNYKWQLSRHVLLHEDDVEVYCNLCGRVFISERSLTIHLIVHHKQKLNNTM